VWTYKEIHDREDDVTSSLRQSGIYKLETRSDMIHSMLITDYYQE
jgi:hypothetical protein